MKAAAQILAFYFLLGSLFPGTDFSQLSKLCKLLEHFELHQQAAAQQRQTLTFTTFLLDHFNGDASHEHGDAGQSHQELPLQSLQYFPMVLPEHSSMLALTPHKPTTSLFIAEEDAMPSGFRGSIFRPPVLS
jgi:hypothetical protein